MQSNDRISINDPLKETWNKPAFLNLRCYPSIYLDGQGNAWDRM